MVITELRPGVQVAADAVQRVNRRPVQVRLRQGREVDGLAVLRDDLATQAGQLGLDPQTFYVKPIRREMSCVVLLL